MKHKLKILKIVAKKLNDEGITWALGGSLLLYFKGYVEHFNDIDILVDELDIDQCIEVMDSFGLSITQDDNTSFKTRHFHQYLIEGVDFDVMAGFVIVSEGIEHECPLNKEDIALYDYENVLLPLHSIREWRRYYALMNRLDKVDIIDRNFVK